TFRPCPWNVADELESEELKNDTPRILPTGTNCPCALVPVPAPRFPPRLLLPAWVIPFISPDVAAVAPAVAPLRLCAAPPATLPPVCSAPPARALPPPTSPPPPPSRPPPPPPADIMGALTPASPSKAPSASAIAAGAESDRSTA